MHFDGLNCPKLLWAIPQRGSRLYGKKKEADKTLNTKFVIKINQQLKAYRNLGNNNKKVLTGKFSILKAASKHFFLNNA